MYLSNEWSQGSCVSHPKEVTLKSLVSGKGEQRESFLVAMPLTTAAISVETEGIQLGSPQVSASMVRGDPKVMFGHNGQTDRDHGPVRTT